MAQIRCPHCGQMHSDTAKFCTSTGKLIAPGQQGPSGGIKPLSEYQQPTAQQGMGSHNPTGKLPPNAMLRERYIITQKIGQGGMAAVYRAIDLQQGGVSWAIKEMSESYISDPTERQEAVDGFLLEGQTLRLLNHRNIPRFGDAFSENERQYLVMEFVEGNTLDTLIEQRSASGRPFSVAEVLPWMLQLADALDYLHNQNPPIIFRDLKPGNVMIDQMGQVKLIDFGIIRHFKPGKRHDTIMIGTPGYHAPEAIGGQTDARSDLFSLCVLCHQLLTLRDPVENVLKQFPSIRDSNPTVPEAIDDAILRGLLHSREERWRTVADFRNALLAASREIGTVPISGGGVPGQRPPPGQGVPTKRVTQRLVVFAAGLSTGQLIGLLVGVLVAVVAGILLLGPVLYSVPWLWNNIPLIALAGPAAYAASRRRFATAIAHTIIAVIGGVTIYASIGSSNDENYLPMLIVGALVSALVMEAIAFFVDRGYRKAQQTGKDNANQEVIWLAVMAVVGTVILQATAFGLEAINPVLLIAAAVMGVIGWFIGDLLKEAIANRQTR